MKILFDEGVPLPLRDTFSSDTVDTVQTRGWGGKPDAEVLRLAEAEDYQVFITTDKSIVHQQDTTKLRIRVYSLPTTSWPKLKSQAQAIANDVRALLGTRSDFQHGNVDE